MLQKDLERINELAHLAKQRPLTEAEEKERAELRKAYIKSFRESLAGQLENTVIRYPDGREEKLARKTDK